VKELDVSILTANWNKPRLGNSEEAASKYHMMKETMKDGTETAIVIENGLED
jgi:hypothetical protein